MKLIDADKLIRCLRNDPLFKFIGQYGVTGVIDAQPTVEAEPVRHGKWARQTIGTAEYGTTVMYRCNECEETTISKYKYCPHCGARMDL